MSLLQKKYVKEELIGGQFFVESSLEAAFATEFPAISTETKKKASARIMQTTEATPNRVNISNNFRIFYWLNLKINKFLIFYFKIAFH